MTRAASPVLRPEKDGGLLADEEVGVVSRLVSPIGRLPMTPEGFGPLADLSAQRRRRRRPMRIKVRSRLSAATASVSSIEIVVLLIVTRSIALRKFATGLAVLAVGDRAFGVSGAGAGTAIGLGVGDCDRSR